MVPKLIAPPKKGVYWPQGGGGLIGLGHNWPPKKGEGANWPQKRVNWSKKRGGAIGPKKGYIGHKTNYPKGGLIAPPQKTGYIGPKVNCPPKRGGGLLVPNGGVN